MPGHEQARADHGRTVGTTLGLAIDALKRDAPAALDLLRLLTFLAPEPVPMQVLTGYAAVLPPRLAKTAGSRRRLTGIIDTLQGLA